MLWQTLSDLSKIQNLLKQKIPNQAHRCRQQIGDCQGQGTSGGQMGEEGQEVQISSCKINKGTI